MTVYTLIVIACLSSNPSDCRTHEEIVQGSAIPTTAFIEAQAKAAKWIVDHPGYQIGSVKLLPGRGA